LDVATTAVFAAGLLLIKGPLERLVGEALDRRVVRQLNLEEDSSM
jgi:energy-converting hydrogenase Eha subunit E